ncbi:tail fiber domain-containing protein [Rhizobium sp. BR 362]|uniref:tail fiber domain-containing protein n=1 Tax=Rhizobium sp. BR 362 TaxID=3040670 RepID=UPI002F4298D2
MVSTPSPPKAPDPQATASAQTSTNLATAQANAAMNNVNQVTPYGNLTYSQTGQNFIADPNGQQYYVDGSGQYHSSLPTHSVTTPGSPGTQSSVVRYDKNGQPIYTNTGATAASTKDVAYTPDGWTATKGYYVPTYTATQTLSPEQQKILDQTQPAQLNLGTLANQQSAKMIDYLNQPVDLSAQNLDNYTNTHWMGGFNNTWDRNQANLDQSLADKGISIGSEAYSNAYRDFTNNKQAANDQYLGDMYDRAQSAILAQRNQPINEISALLSGSQVTQPNYASSTSTSTIPTTDYAGIVNQGYQNQMAGYNAQLQQSNAAMGGLFGLGSSLLGGWAMSDRRLKTNIRQIGTMTNGLKLYAFDYIWGEPSAGFMADEVAEMVPDAVRVGPGGFLMVDYARAA